MAKNIRVYELARELGLSNKEALDLCVSLGIGVKSHSSSIEEAQADRVRRKAEREGLVRATQPEEPATEARTGGGRGAQRAPEPAPTPAPEPPRAEPPRAEPPRAEPPRAERPAERPAPPAERPAPPAPRPIAPAASPAPPAEPQSRPAAPAASEHHVVRSRPASEVAEPRPAPAPPRPTPAPRPGEQPAAAAPGARPAPSGAPRPAPGRPAPAPGRPGQSGDRRPLLGPSGKPIPPPPGGPPRSPSGRPIPPPPGMGGRGPAPVTGRPGGGAPRPGGFGGRPGGGAPRPGGFGGRPGGGAGGGGFGGRPGGGAGGGGFGGRPGGGVGAPAGARGGPAGRGRPPQRRTHRRRRNVEELEPIQVSTYTPSNAPVPDHEVIIERGSTPQEVGPKLNRSAGDVIRFLFLQGEVVTATQSLTDDMIELFAAELGARIRLVDTGEEQEAALEAKFFADEEVDPAALRPRPPVVTVMGHVDHGKTTVLDRIRQTDVVAGEAGGITQHIGAYQVEKNGQRITFIDTPGHEAFTAMRARGAQVTDIVVLVVAADDGVMPQTIEAIDHAKAANVPIIVAVNKIDREDADPNRVLQQLSERGLVPEAWGGDTIAVEMSALQGLGIDDLLEQILVLSEVLELKASPEGRARATVLEANLDIGRGPVATVIVERGTLRVGDPIVAGAAWGRVRALIDDHGDQVKEAWPSMPVQVLGCSEPPVAGDELRVTEDVSDAETIARAREQRLRFAGYASTAVASGAGGKLEDIFEQIQRGETATLTLVLKADVQGSLEAVTESLRRLEREEVKVAFVRRAVGGISEQDVQLASASNATIIGFNVRPNRRARELAETQGVEIRTYEIIYKLIEDIEAAMVGMLAPTFEEVVTGEAEVREIFRVPRIGAIAGCYVRNGTITRGSKVRFLRDGVVIWKGAISSLRRFKDDVREVQSGFECGIGLTDFQDLHEGDIIETFEEREVPRT
ncbi:MAG: translation initiation factor IF-2 [Actinomycetota bacterium]|nr:translation initiation factor IF-2 [Actinomycetota bacterium]